MILCKVYDRVGKYVGALVMAICTLCEETVVKMSLLRKLQSVDKNYATDGALYLFRHWPSTWPSIFIVCSTSLMLRQPFKNMSSIVGMKMAYSNHQCY